MELCSEQLGLLHPRADVQLLHSFPVPIRKQLADTILRFLSSADAGHCVTSLGQLEWAFEITGECFCLPIEEAETIGLAIKVYTSFLDGTIQIPVFVEDKKELIQKIFLHFSRMFDERGLTGVMLDHQVEYCNQIMAAIAVFCRSKGTNAEESSKIYTLKILLGMTHALMSAKPGENIGNRMSGNMMKLFFETLIRSEIWDLGFWRQTSDVLEGWVSRPQAVQQWSELMMALSKKICRILYGNTEGTAAIDLKSFDKPLIQVEVGDKHVFHVFHRLLKILGDPNQIEDPNQFQAIIKGYSAISNLFVGVGRTLPPAQRGHAQPLTPNPPNTDSVLSFFGSIFFAALKMPMDKYTGGITVAYSALCQMFCARTAVSAEDSKLSRFYGCIKDGLSSGNFAVVQSILLHSTKLFLCEPKGCHILIHDFMDAIRGILLGLAFVDQKPSVELKSACLTLLGSMMCIPRYFHNVHYALDCTHSSHEFIEMTREPIDYDFGSVCLRVLVTESNAVILEKTMHMMTVLCFDRINEFPHLTTLFITQLLQGITTNLTAVSFCIFEVLSDLTPLAEKVESNNQETLKNLATELCNFIITKKRQNGEPPQIAAALYCLLDWLMNAPWILQHRELVKLTLDAVDATRPPSAKASSVQNSLSAEAEAGECVLAHLLSIMGNFPSLIGVQNVSSLITEDIEFEELKMSGVEWSGEATLCRYLMLDNCSVLTVVEKPKQGGGGVTVIIRDATGRNSWDFAIADAHHECHKPTDCARQNSKNFPPVQPIAASETGKDKLLSALSMNMKSPPISPWEALVDEQKSAECGVDDKSIAAADTWMEGETVPQLNRCKMLCSHLGLLTYENGDKVALMDKGQKLGRNINSLDRTHERESHKIGVIYVKEGQQSQRTLMHNEAGSEMYELFISQLGWKVPLDSHTGFMGGLDPFLSTGKCAPYVATFNYECVFHVPTMMPNNYKDPQQIHKKRHVGNDHVHIVWNETPFEYRPNTITSQFNHVHIVVNPLPSGLFQITVHQKESEKLHPFGPLRDGVIVRFEILGLLVRATAVNANRRVRYKTEGYRRPFPTRCSLLEEIKSRYSLHVKPPNLIAAMCNPGVRAAGPIQEAAT